MGFSFVRSLVKHTLTFGGDALGGGIVPIGSIASAVYVEWCESREQSAKDQAPPAAEQARVRAELEQIVQDPRAYRAQVDQLLPELGAGQPETVRQAARTYLNQIPGWVQRSLRRPDDPSGRTVPVGLALRRAEDLQKLLPERMPLFQPGAKPVAGTDLVIEELIGVGAFGEVWKARHQSRPHAPPVALKFCVDETAARTLRKEIELLDRISQQGRHRGIVELRYVHLETNPPCLEYEYVEGGDLACLVTDLHRAGKGTPLTMTRLLCSLAQAVGVAHRIQPPVVHRDLKPTNVLTTRVEKRVVLKVADFGIGALAADQAKRAAGETAGDGTRTVSTEYCTPLYASPQLRRGAGPDPRDDVYALGVIWYQMLIGDVAKEPPRGGSWKKRLLDQGTTPNMLALLERCLEDDPADRPADAQVLAQELLAVIKEATPDAIPEVVAADAEQKAVAAQPRPKKQGRFPDDAVREVVAADKKQKRVSAQPRPEMQGRPPDAAEARRKADAASGWFLRAGIWDLALIVCCLALVPGGFFPSIGALLLFLLLNVGFLGAAASCHFWATAGLKNCRGKGKVVAGILFGFLSLPWAGLTYYLSYEEFFKRHYYYGSDRLAILLSLVLIPTVLVNVFAAIRGIMVLFNAAVREQFRRPENTTEDPRPVFGKTLGLSLIPGLAGWFVLVLLVVLATRPGPTVTKANFDKLAVGMDGSQVRAILGPATDADHYSGANLGEVAEAFGSGPEELSRKAHWITAGKYKPNAKNQNYKSPPMSRWKDGDKIILALYEFNSRVAMLCYSSTDPNNGRVSESKGSDPYPSQVNREIFDTLAVGMTQDQVERRLESSNRQSDAKEIGAALGALQENKEGWTNALNEDRLSVFSDGVGTRIFVAYSTPGYYVSDRKAQAFYYLWTGLVPSDRLIAQKGELGETGIPGK